MTKENRSTDLRLGQRVDIIYRMLLMGSSRQDICRFVSELVAEHKKDPAKQPDPWDVSDRQLDRYIQMANKLFEEAAAIHRPRAFGRALARREDLYQRAMRLQDLGKALAVEQDIAKLCDLYTSENKAAQLAAQVSLLENKLEELQKREVLLAFLKEHATKDVYEEVIRLLAGGPAKKSEGGSNVRLQWEDARAGGDDPGSDPLSTTTGDSEPSSPL